MRQTKYRLILVTGLVAGLGAGGVAPCEVAGTSCPIAVAAAGAVRGCCCGVVGGCQCGTGCRQAPTPPQDRAPAPPRPTDDSTLALGLANAAQLAIDSPAEVPNWHSLFAAPPLWPADSSLLALSVRLNL